MRAPHAGTASIGSQRCPYCEVPADFLVVQRHHHPCVRGQGEQIREYHEYAIGNRKIHAWSWPRQFIILLPQVSPCHRPNILQSLGACKSTCGMPGACGSQRPLLSTAAPPQRDAVVGHVVQERAAVDALVQRVAHRVQHLPRHVHLRPHLPAERYGFCPVCKTLCNSSQNLP